MARALRVGRWLIRIGRFDDDDTVGIGEAWEAQVDGRVTALLDSPHGLLVGTSEGAVSRLETKTGRRCALANFAGAIDALALSPDGRFVVVTTTAGQEQRLVRSLKTPKPGADARGRKPVPTRRRRPGLAR